MLYVRQVYQNPPRCSRLSRRFLACREFGWCLSSVAKYDFSWFLCSLLLKFAGKTGVGNAAQTPPVWVVSQDHCTLFQLAQFDALIFSRLPSLMGFGTLQCS